MTYQECDERAHIVDSLQNGECELKPLKERIKEAYHQFPHASGEQILEIVETKDNLTSRRALLQAQKELRNYTAAERQNHNAHPFRVKQGG